jgi:hypothetical protein
MQAMTTSIIPCLPSDGPPECSKTREIVGAPSTPDLLEIESWIGLMFSKN